MYKLNFNHLYYFLTIAKEGTIVKAAKKLNVSQPALSHQLKCLEQDLEKKLFDRVGRKLVLNDDGEAVKEYASKIFRHSEEMVQFLKSNNRHLIKIIRIGTLPWLSNRQVYQFLKPLMANQFIQLEVYQKDLDSLIKDIQSKRLDLILCDSPYSGRSQKLTGLEVTIEPIFCVAKSKQTFPGRFPSCLKGKKHLHYSEASQTADKIETFLSENKISVQTVGAFTDSELIKYCVEKGNAFAFLPASIVKESLKQKKLAKLGQVPNAQFSLWAIFDKSTQSDSIIQSVLNKSIKNTH